MLSILDQPLASAWLTTLRDESTSSHTFQQTLTRLGMALALSASSHLPYKIVEVTTPLEDTSGLRLSTQPHLVPILRAGLGLLPGVEAVLPTAPIHEVGLRRDEITLRPQLYKNELPEDLRGKPVWLLDPMLATGGSLKAVYDLLKDRNPGPVSALTVLAAPEGIANLKALPIHVFTASLDVALNAQGFIVPGLGDAGDRLFGTS